MTIHLLSALTDFTLKIASISVWLVLLICIFVPLEHLFGVHPKRILRKQVGVDLSWYFVNSLLPSAMLAVPLLMLARLVHGLDPGGLHSAVAAWPLWLKLLAGLFVGDIGAYWAHRAFHRFPILWRFHQVHHSAEDLDWLVNTRAHPFELVATRMAAVAPVYLLGLAQAQAGGVDPIVVWIQFFGTVWTFFIHANLRFRFGLLEWLLSTPAFHHWHHTNDENRNHNFAAIFPVIDKIFGTALLPRHWPPAYGIKGEVSHTLVGQLLDPLTFGTAPSAVRSVEAQAR
jgi:sterol desaturase/sphingolipid hydroxylase (fatty acid hydroxylase superfamily)